MNDNFGTLRALFTGCAIEERDIPELGLTTAAFAYSDASIGIYNIDTQGSLEDFLTENGDYFVLSYYGKIPNITFRYHIDGIPQGDIFSLHSDGKKMVELMFNPHDDFITGTINKFIPSEAFSGKTATEIRDNDVKYKRRTFGIYLQYVGAVEGIVTCNADQIDIVVINELGVKGVIGTMFLDRTVYGTIRKMVNIEFGTETAIASFSKGRIPVASPCSITAAQSAERVHVPTLIEKYPNPALEAIYKSVLKPNKIFNTEATI